MVKKLQEAEELWEEVLNQVPVTDKAIIPITNKMAEKTEYEMEKYCRKFKILEMDFRAKKMWSYETGPKGAMEDMAEAHKEVEAEKKTMHEMSHLCEIFGYPSAIDDAKEYMGMLDGYLESMERLWGHPPSSPSTSAPRTCSGARSTSSRSRTWPRRKDREEVRRKRQVLQGLSGAR